MGSTFELSLLVNTGGEAINAVDVTVTFPADKLQVVNPSVGSSFVTVWVTPPSFSNTEGTLTFTGEVPHPGFTGTAALLSTVLFLVKAPGTATVAFADRSRVLRNDGQGTNILSARASATLTLMLPPPAGPIVSSPTHPDQQTWYNHHTVTFTWDAPDGATDYSFTLSENPSTVPDEISEGNVTSKTYADLPDGIHYFHIRAKNRDGWGGTSHFAVRLDTTPPASFRPSVYPRSRTTRPSPLISFVTTDALSGIDHYEVRVTGADQTGSSDLFTEERSPYQLPELSPGQYVVVVRAVDRAGNYTDASVDLTILKQSTFLEGALILVPERFPYPIAWLITLFILPLLLSLLFFFLRRRSIAARAVQNIELLEQDIAKIKKTHEEIDRLRRLLSSELSTLHRTISEEASPEWPPSSAVSQHPPGSPPPSAGTVGNPQDKEKEE